MMQTILFLCPHNAAKSVIAAAYFNQLAQQQGLNFTADSAGTEPSDSVSLAVAAMLQMEGINVSDFQPRRVTEDDLSSAYRVISMGCSAEELEVAPEQVEQWFDVPMVSQNLNAARDVIRARVEALARQLAT